MTTVDDNIIYFFDDKVDIITSNTCNGLDLVFNGGVGILFGEFKHHIDLIIELITFVRFT